MAVPEWPDELSPQQVPCDALETVHQYVKHPPTLIWWTQFNQRGRPMPIDEVGAWNRKSQTPYRWDVMATAGSDPRPDQ